jgi:hypothetical protein
MRNPLRLVAPVIAVAALVLAGASSALAAAQPSSASLDESWCFQDSPTIEYCFDVTGTVKYLDTQAGSTVNIHATTRTRVYESGQYAGESKSVEFFRGVFQADGTVVMQSLVHTRSRVGDEACTYHLVLRLADYEAVVYHVNSTCGG